MTQPLIYVDVLKDTPRTLEEFQYDNRGADVDDIAAEYRIYKERFQPYRIIVTSGDNHEPLFRSTESYFNRADAIHAAQIAFGRGSNVYLREHEKGNVQLRLASDGPGEPITW